jgi:hypothetical protein
MADYRMIFFKILARRIAVNIDKLPELLKTSDQRAQLVSVV